MHFILFSFPSPRAMVPARADKIKRICLSDRLEKPVHIVHICKALKKISIHTHMYLYSFIDHYCKQVYECGYSLDGDLERKFFIENNTKNENPF